MFCDCGRKKDIEDLSCFICSSCSLVIDCAKQQKLLPAVITILNPVVCPKCNKTFPDADSLDDHSIVHGNSSFNLTGQKMVLENKAQGQKASTNKTQGQKKVPQDMSVPQLKEALREKGLSTSETKNILKRRLEGVLLEN
jgi:uncharacterized Zn-finger protein